MLSCGGDCEQAITSITQRPAARFADFRMKGTMVSPSFSPALSLFCLIEKVVVQLLDQSQVDLLSLFGPMH